MSSAVYDTQLPITRTLPCLGPSHHPSSHSEPAPDANEITEYLAASSPTTPPEAAQALCSNHVGLPAVLQALVPGVFLPQGLRASVPLPERFFPSSLHTGSLISKSQLRDNTPYYLLFRSCIQLCSYAASVNTECLLVSTHLSTTGNAAGGQALLSHSLVCSQHLKLCLGNSPLSSGEGSLGSTPGQGTKIAQAARPK